MQKRRDLLLVVDMQNVYLPNEEWACPKVKDAIKNGGPAPIPSSEILYNQAIIDGIVKSAELGKEIQIEIPEI